MSLFRERLKFKEEFFKEMTKSISFYEDFYDKYPGHQMGTEILSYEKFSEYHTGLDVNGQKWTTRPTEIGKAEPMMAITMDRVCADHGFSGHKMLNIRPAKLAAWKAHRTMGTYDKAAA